MGKGAINIKMYVRVRAWDQLGRITHDVKEPSGSLVQAFLGALLANMANISLSGTHLDITDTARTFTGATTTGQSQYRADAVLGVDTNGIVIGTTNTPVDITDNKMLAQIAHGTGSGQMTYASMVLPTNITISDPNATFVISRNFNNNSGATITVREVGIYTDMTRTVGSLGDFCMVRDVPTELAVVDGGGAQVEYTFQISE